jgi:3-keto-disaccharide hydrolase
LDSSIQKAIDKHQEEKNNSRLLYKDSNNRKSATKSIAAEVLSLIKRRSGMTPKNIPRGLADWAMYDTDRFRNPDSTGDYNPAWSAVFSGFEVQIDNLGAPDGFAKHRTGAVYNVNYPGDPAPTPGVSPPTQDDFVNPQNAGVLAWNQLRIEVQGNTIFVNLNAVDTAKYTNPDPNRGQFSPAQPTFIGLQSYSNYSYTTAFRRIRVTVL